MKLHILIFALVLVALLISAACGDDEEDLVELFEKNLVAYNAGDLAKVLDDYADDAFVKGGQCPKGCTGKEEFGKEIEWRVAGFDSFTLVMPSQARGTFVSWVQEFRGPILEEAGVSRIISQGITEFIDGKITREIYGLHLADQETAAFFEFLQAQ